MNSSVREEEELVASVLESLVLERTSYSDAKQKILVFIESLLENRTREILEQIPNEYNWELNNEGMEVYTGTEPKFKAELKQKYLKD